MKKLVSVIALVLGFVLTVQAEVITILDSNSTISAGDSFDTVVIKGDGTVVDMTGGTVNKLITMNASTFNMSGGDISSEVSWYTCSYDTSVLNISGGTLYRLMCYGRSTVNISGNTLITGCQSHDSSLLTISGDSEITGWEGIEIRGHSVLKVTGGTVSMISVREGSPTIDLSGGTIGTLASNSGGAFTGVVRIIGYDLNAVPYGGESGLGEVTGNWNNDTLFSFNLSYGVYSFFELYDGIIPVNCVNPPQSDINGDCIVNLLDLSKIASEWLDNGTQ